MSPLYKCSMHISEQCCKFKKAGLYIVGEFVKNSTAIYEAPTHGPRMSLSRHNSAITSSIKIILFNACLNYVVSFKARP